MSLFSALGQGDIWSAGGITFASPINDILDKESYTIEELLEEDELLQEMKSGNDRLLEFVFEEENMAKLVGYIVTPSQEGDSEMRIYRYPYMSCELFCCENPRILNRLVEYNDGRFLKQLFSLLSLEAPLDHYLAGYFEKVLEMLFRRMTVPVMAFLNEGSMDLLQRFVNHIDNYSIMQIVQRVLLPHIPFSIDDVDLPAAMREKYQCDWSFKEESCNLLCAKMLDHDSHIVPSHIADMLITVLQLSPHESSVLSNLCVSEYLGKMLESSFNDGAEMTSITDEPTVESSISLASISVLESLISRLCETMSCIDFGAIGDDENTEMTVEDARRLSTQVAASVDKMSQAIVPYIPKIAAQLRVHLDTPVCGTFDSQTQSTHKRLGPRGLYLVKLIESTVRLANDEIDDVMCSSGVFRNCIDLMFAYELHSILHLSVQRIVLNLIEVGATYRTLRHLLSDCGLIDRIIDMIREETEDCPDASPGSSKAHLRVSGCRRPVVGHVITIAQSLFASLHDTEDSVQERAEAANTSQDSVDRLHSTSAVLRQVLEDTNLIEKWEAFEREEFHELISKQIAISVPDNDTSNTSVELPLESLKLSENWPVGDDEDKDLSSRKFNHDDDDDDDDDYFKPTYNLPTYGATDASSSSYSHHDSYSSSDDEADDDGREIGDQFADFGAGGNTENFAAFPELGADATQQPTFEAQFDANFDAQFDTGDSGAATFEANFDAPAASSDFFAAFPTPTDATADSAAPVESSSGGGEDPFDPFGIGDAVDDAFADIVNVESVQSTENDGEQ